MQKNKKIVLFDIDYTLFDVQVFGEKVSSPLAEKLGITDKKRFFEMAKVANEKSKQEKGYYHPTIYLNLLKEAARSAVPLAELEKIYYDEEFYKAALYEDAQVVFAELVKKKVEIAIFSKGHEPFQALKVRAFHENLPENKVHIFTDKLEKLKDILRIYENYDIYFVDDMLLVLEAAKKLDSNVTTIFIKREIRVDIQSTNKFKPDYTINKLLDLIPLV